MNTLWIILLAVQGIVFLVWALLAFRWLFAIMGEARARSGHTLPGFGAQLRAFGTGLSDPRFRQHRVRLIVATVILVALTVLSAFVGR